MSGEGHVRQRQLVGINVLLDDARWYAKYVFPFFNVGWRVPLVALDVLGRPPRIWDRSMKLIGLDLRIDATADEMKPATTEDAKRFAGLLHFDPWWAFKGAGFPPDLVRAVVATNVAGRSHLLDVPRTVADVSFDRDLEFLRSVELEDEHFGRRAFVEGTLDLRKLRV